jgi:hypothetical protein
MLSFDVGPHFNANLSKQYYNKFAKFKSSRLVVLCASYGKFWMSLPMLGGSKNEMRIS